MLYDSPKDFLFGLMLGVVVTLLIVWAYTVR